MRFLIDTNVLFAAIVFPGGVSDKALSLCLARGNEVVIPEYVLDELKETIERKFPCKSGLVMPFLGSIGHIELPNSALNEAGETLPLRDLKDMPILRAAIVSQSDYILTGDLDFLESSLTKPTPIHPSSYLKNPF